MKQQPTQPGEIASNFVSGGNTLAFRWTYPTTQAPYTFVLEGWDGDQPFSIHLNREGVMQLMRLMFEAV